MTGNDHRPAEQHLHDPSNDPQDQRATPADLIEAGAVVPITVWRLDDRDGERSVTGPGAGFASRLARRLILTYTRPGETIVDFDADQHLREASIAASRIYLAITHGGELADLDPITCPVSLVILHWPRQAPTWPAASIADLFTACRLIMNADTCAIAAVSSAQPGRPGTTYTQHLAELLPAARTAGLTHVLQIVAVVGPVDGDQFLYYATGAEADVARGSNPACHVDLLVFTTSPGSP